MALTALQDEEFTPQISDTRIDFSLVVQELHDPVVHTA
jgi:hypothetical protein